MISIILFVILAAIPTAELALDAMLEGTPFQSAQEPVLIEYGDVFLLPENPELVKFAILRQFHRMAFQLSQEPVIQLADYITVNWGYLDTDTRNLWREYAGRTGLPVPIEEINPDNITSILRYCSESGKQPPTINLLELNDLQRFYYVSSLSPVESLGFINDTNWAVRNIVMQKNPQSASQMFDDPSLYIQMNAAKIAGRSDLLMELASTTGPIGHMSLSGVGQIPILEDSLFESANPAIRASSLVALFELGWRIPEEKMDILFSDEYEMIGALTADFLGTDFVFSPEGSLPEQVSRIEDIPDQLVLVTDVGDFRLTLLKDEAPVTCRSFWHLAKSGFYNGIYFHRVIPGFVAQAGCPEGNGYGGPGYVIPAENNCVSYKRGVVGMADSGMDTGGSQFFIMLDNQRRLDCRYTVFAVLDDAENIDDIEIGTSILEIREVNL